MAAGPVVAAGAVVTRRGGREVLMVHRPRYDDWTFPKGKRDPGEHVTATAVREVLEETGVRIRLLRPLPRQRYAVNGSREKTVDYWVGRAIDGDPADRPADTEVDLVHWVPLTEAAERLTYARDRDLLGALAERGKRTTALVVVRHGHARTRAGWTGPDPDRPLTTAGLHQARALPPVLAAYDVCRLIASPSLRCVQTLEPGAAALGRRVEPIAGLSEEHRSATAIDALLSELLETRTATAVCSHRPVLPLLLDRLGVSEEPLAPGELLVCHHRGGRVRSVERYLPTR